MRLFGRAFCLQIALFVLGPIAAAASDIIPPLLPAVSAQFAPGQVWTYHTRPHETASRIIVGKIEKLPNSLIIVHIKVTNLVMRYAPKPDDVGRGISHIPITEELLSKSVIDLVEIDGDFSDLKDGYQTWLSHYRKDDAGVFTLTVAEIVKLLEETLAKGKETKT